MIGKKAQEYDRLDLNMGNFALPFGDFPAIEVGNNIEVSEDEPSEITFVLDEVPGAPDAKEIVVTQDPEDEELAEVTIDGESVGKWEWEHKTFLKWLKNMFDNVPRHSGRDSTGLEKVIGYLEALEKEISKALRTDFNNEIDNTLSEKAREEIEKGIRNSIERLKAVNKEKYPRKSKKASDDSEGLVKEAQKATRINGITITVPLLISRIARVCINGTVSAGHDIEDMFERQATEYNLDKRERAELSQLISDMGYSMIQDRGFAPGTNVDMARSDNYDWGANFRG